MNERYDIIGDIHGHADELVVLLRALGYAEAEQSLSTSEGPESHLPGRFHR